MARSLSPRPGPSERVREDCARVAGSARLVHIDEHALRRLAESLEPRALDLPSLDPSCHFLGHGEGTVCFMLALEAVNFGSASFEQLRHPPGQSSGYFTVAGALKRYFDRQGPPSAEQLASLDLKTAYEMFDQQGHAPAESLLRRFTDALQQLGTYVQQEYEGSFADLLRAAEGRAEKLVEIMLGIEPFRDQADYRGETVRLYKRAQLTAADLSLAFGGEGPGRFEGLDRLTIFADDLVPHVLRLDGVLRYDEELARHIDAGQPIAAGSESEIEIRACAVHACELIVAELHRQGRGVPAMQVDYCLWNRGLAPAYRRLPRHRTVTDFY